jgi:MazG family protein
MTKPHPESRIRRDAGNAFLALCDLMSDLRAPDGCDWDRAQDLHTLRAYLLEETHEVLDVLNDLAPTGDGDRAPEHRDELGDLMLQIVFQSEIQRESGRFDAGDVCQAIHDKLVRRHPHLFGSDEEKAAGKPSWEGLKRKERQGKTDEPVSALDGVPKELPALLRAYRVGEKAHRVGFDWPDHNGVLAKIDEELLELREAIAADDKREIEAELGDLMYALVNLTRHFEVDPEAALRRTITKFERRFRVVEARAAADGHTPEELSLDELEAHWEAAKAEAP